MTERTRRKRCIPGCLAKYQAKGSKRFKKTDGSRFASCVEAFSECCLGVDDPKRLCAYIGRRAGRIR